MKNIPRLAIALAIALGTVIALIIALGTVAVPAFAYPEVEPVVMAPADVITITILHTNDFHGHVDEWESWGNVYGGSARIATKINEIRDAQDNVLVLDAGDQFQGTLFYSLFKADIVTVTMNALGYDAMAVGNHEFDDGPSELARLIDGVNFPVLSANIDASAEPDLAGKIEPSTVITLSGEPIGIVGLTTPDAENISSPGPNVTFSDTVTSLQAEVDALTTQGIDKIIALTHLGYDEDLVLAAAVTGVDVIVGGHSHTYLYTPPDDAAGPYPTVINAPDGNPVLIVTANCWGRYLGHLDVTFDTTGTVSSYAGNPILMSDTITPDAGVEAIVATYRPQVEELMNTIVGTSTVEMPLSVSDRRICRMGECLLGNLVTDAMLWKINSVAPEQYQMAIQNGGGLRAPIDAGPISAGEIMELLPFGNAIATFEITGTYIIEALENGVSRFPPTLDGRFPQVAGMRYTWNPNMPAGSRIVAVEVLSGTSYVPLNETAIYRVVTNDFMRGGGDGYTVFSDFAIDPYDFGPALDEALMDYVTEFSPVSPTIEGRIIGPDIVVTPLTLSAELDQGDTTTDTLTISNMGTVTRTWNMTKATTADWLTLAQTSGTLVPEEVVITGTATMIMPDSVDVVATFDAADLEAGFYTTTLVVTSDAPDESPVNVPVTLTVNEFKIFLPLVLRNYGS
ncbi:MAG: bifunctional metallophosphatase/5'-nucleotidase [Chloroflexota bacterium]|nr:bifunctional metallophosphatase/5'-nucleotidase [Chloroflexota bacterium]